jgi:hypothetical protein
LIICERDGCEEKFTPATHNQKYCNPECCRIATNQRIMQKYYAKRDRQKGKVRICDVCVVTKLSRYNSDTTCSGCKLEQNASANRLVVDMFHGVSFVA